MIDLEAMRKAERQAEVDTVNMAFEVLRRATMAGGGDGFGAMVCPNPMAMADAFERYEHALPEPWFTERDGTTFLNCQEAIFFVASRVEAEHADEIIIELRHLLEA